jgi:hypothetical protein
MLQFSIRYEGLDDTSIKFKIKSNEIRHELVYLLMNQIGGDLEYENDCREKEKKESAIEAESNISKSK